MELANITIICWRCHTIYTVPQITLEHNAAARGECPQCHTVITIASGNAPKTQPLPRPTERKA